MQAEALAAASTSLSQYEMFLFSYTISLTRAVRTASSLLNVIIACGKFPLASLLQFLPQHISLNR